MRISIEDPRRIEIIPETDAEKQICQDILDGKAVIYWGDAGENFTPAEMLGGLIINTYAPNKTEGQVANSSDAF